MKKRIVVALLLFFIVSVVSKADTINPPSWVNNFKKYEGNPVLLPSGTGFEAMAVFNPATILEKGKFYMFYRAEGWGAENWPKWNERPAGWNEDKDWPGISVIGLAISDDGINFKKMEFPVIVPEFDYENIGGCEDSRIVKIGDTFYLTYTGVGGTYTDAGVKNKISRLCMATSKDLTNWKKHGPLFSEEWEDTRAGAIIPEKINGKYWMYFGASNIWLAHSTDLINWTCDKEKDVVLKPRDGFFDEQLVESGPPPVVTDEGTLLIYNGADFGAPLRIGHYTVGIGEEKERFYRVGWALFSKDDPSKILARSDKPILEPVEEFEKNGQVSNVVFSQGLVKKDNVYYLYYGGSDTYIGLAISK